MAITNFIPEIWNSQLLVSFAQNAVAANLVNRSYEGDATKGNTVHITGAVDVEIKDYAAANRITEADEIADTGQELLIDQEKVFDFFVDDIDRAQASGSMEAYTYTAGRSLAADADKFILALAAAGDEDPASGDLADGNAAHDVIRDLRKKLNKRHVPMGDRYLIVNAEFEAVLLGSDAKLTSVDVSGTPDGLREATLGRYLGFTVVTTENLPETDAPMAIGLYGPAIAYVSQIEKTEAMRAQNKFADRLRGLHVYGGKVIRPEGIAVFNAGGGNGGGDNPSS